jgi:transposase
MQYNALQEGSIMARLKGSADLLENRRRRALALWDTGLSLNEVGRRVGCAASSVMRWLRARRRGGAEALRVRFSPGRPLKLSVSQRRRLLRLLLKGAPAHGYRTQLWTTARIAEVIKREFGVRYHRDHVGRLMHSLNWSPQKPETRAVERDEASIERWKRNKWPRVKKTPRGWAPI